MDVFFPFRIMLVTYAKIKYGSFVAWPRRIIVDAHHIRGSEKSSQGLMDVPQNSDAMLKIDFGSD